ncbi:MAG: HAD family phosphatase [Alistipes sp.]|nr:HAD family phosphatase [Alistipes sp.]
MKNVVFDLGRVVFAQDPAKSTAEFKQFFSYVSLTPMPQFWVDYDMGVLTIDQVADELAVYRGVEPAFAREMIQIAIGKQETIAPTAELIADLKQAGYRLYVLSNMSREFIDFLREQEVYANFDGDVVSCEVGVVKPMPEIYDVLLERFSLEPSETIFIDDRRENIDAAEAKGISAFHFDRNDYAGSCERLREILL